MKKCSISRVVRELEGSSRPLVSATKWGARHKPTAKISIPTLGSYTRHAQRHQNKNTERQQLPRSITPTSFRVDTTPVHVCHVCSVKYLPLRHWVESGSAEPSRSVQRHHRPLRGGVLLAQADGPNRCRSLQRLFSLAVTAQHGTQTGAVTTESLRKEQSPRS